MRTRFSNSIRPIRRSPSKSGTCSGARKASSPNSAGQSRSIASIRRNHRSSRRFRRRASIPRIAKRDEHLRTADFFNVREYPEITFKSRRVKQTGANAGEIAGDLTMHGVTRPITLNVQLLGDPEAPRRIRRPAGASPRRRSNGATSDWLARAPRRCSMIGDDVASRDRNRSAAREVTFSRIPGGTTAVSSHLRPIIWDGTAPVPPGRR